MDRVPGRQPLVVYTAIFGGYDALREPRERAPGVQYVCFTDNPHLRSDTWEVRHCAPSGDPLFQAKRFKMLAHEVLDCEASLWIDGHVQLIALNGALDRLTADLGLVEHPLRRCIYAEAAHCKRARHGDPARIDEAVRSYRAERHPAGYGLWRGGILLRRHTASTAAFNLHWWHEVNRGTSRDQIVLPVVLRRLRTRFQTLPIGVPRYRVGPHLR